MDLCKKKLRTKKRCKSFFLSQMHLTPVNIKTSSTYQSPSSHVTLCFVSALRCKNWVVSSGIGDVVLLLMVHCLLLFAMIVFS